MLLLFKRICLGDGGRKRDVAKGRWLEDGVMQGELHLEVKGTALTKASLWPPKPAKPVLVPVR